MKSPVPVRFYHEVLPPNVLEGQPPLGIIIVPDAEKSYARAWWVNADGRALPLITYPAQYRQAENMEILSVSGKYLLTPNRTVRFPLMLDGEEFEMLPKFGLTWGVLNNTFVPSAGWTIDPLPTGNSNALVKIVSDKTALKYRVIVLGASSTSSGYVHNQLIPATVWSITHNLGYNPIVEIFDSTGDMIIADVEHISMNVATVTFASPATGTAYLR